MSRYRDDKSFPNILLREDHPFPQLLKHRGAKTIKGVYFGPFASAGAVNRTLNTLQRAFLLRSCSDSVFDSRTRPCLLFQIKRCSAPCVGRIDEAGYQRTGRGSRELPATAKAARCRTTAQGGNDRGPPTRWISRPRRKLRDRLQGHEPHPGQRRASIPPPSTKPICSPPISEGGHTCIQVFFFRAGQNWGNRPYFPRHASDLALAEVLECFVGQFYDERTAPRLILTSRRIAGQALLAEALSLRAEHKVEISTPQRGEKREIMERALTNAREQLGRRMAENSAQTQLLEGVADVFGLEQPPRRIEVYDNSHIQGAHALGAFIVAGPEGFEKAQYRKFNIKAEELTPGDDYAMMREVLTRRFARMMKEEAEQVADNREMEASRSGADRRRARASFPSPARSSPIWGWRMWRWWASPKAPTATPAASISTCPARSPSASISKARFSIICNGCATRRTALSSAATARSAAPPSAPIRWTRSRAWARAASAPCCSISAPPGPWRAPAWPTCQPLAG